jgi:hypothetical protein
MRAAHKWKFPAPILPLLCKWHFSVCSPLLWRWAERYLVACGQLKSSHGDLDKLSGKGWGSPMIFLCWLAPSGRRGSPINNICLLGSGTDVLWQNTFWHMFYFFVWTVALRVVTVSVNISLAGNDGAGWRHWSRLWALPCPATQTGWRWLWHEGGWFMCQVHQDLGWQIDRPGAFWHTICATAQRQPNSKVRNVYVREFLT